MSFTCCPLPSPRARVTSSRRIIREINFPTGYLFPASVIPNAPRFMDEMNLMMYAFRVSVKSINYDS